MINPKELQIGNLLHWEADHLGAGASRVTLIKEDGYEIESLCGCYPLDDEMEHIEPIPLTPEWLAKCGFEWNAEEQVYYIQVGNTAYLEYDLDFNCSVVPETWRGHSLHLWGDNKHLHKLQNIYFDLTGEELTIKL